MNKPNVFLEDDLTGARVGDIVLAKGADSTPYYVVGADGHLWGPGVLSDDVRARYDRIVQVVRDGKVVPQVDVP